VEVYFLISGVAGGGCTGWKRTSKGLDLSKIREKCVEIYSISLKIRPKMVPTLLHFKKWRPKFTKKGGEELFFNIKACA